METKITTEERILLNEPYIQTEEDFLKHCQSRGLRINEVHLRLYRERGYIKPAYIIDSYEYYDPFQIHMLWKAEKIRLYTLDEPREINHEGKIITTQIQDWFTYFDSDFYKQQLTKETERFEPLFELLLKIRYYYQPEIEHLFVNRTINTKMPEIIGATKLYAQVKKLKEKEKKNPDFLRLLKIRGKSWEEWQAERELFGAKDALNKSDLKENQIFDWAVDFWMEGSGIDPLGGFHDWRVFLKRIRATNQQRLKRLRGPAALAQDYYILTEMLTNFLQDALQKTYTIQPFDMTDGAIGQWRRKQCERCEQSFEISDWHERFCSACKDSMIQNLYKDGAWKCKNKKCDKTLFLFHDGQHMYDKLPVYGNKRNRTSGGIEPFMPFGITLEYGRMVARIKCPTCDTENTLTVENGWF